MREFTAGDTGSTGIPDQICDRTKLSAVDLDPRDRHSRSPAMSAFVTPRGAWVDHGTKLLSPAPKSGRPAVPRRGAGRATKVDGDVGRRGTGAAAVTAQNHAECAHEA
ncbi:hypothetical protein GCM10020227_05560 [Streptomyces flavovirens]